MTDRDGGSQRMKAHRSVVETHLTLVLTPQEVRDISSGIDELYRQRNNGKSFSWPNLAVADLSFKLVDFINGK